ncbi:MAG: aminotransferase class V-fold PLP-dependent enzyme [Rhodothermales bacterium]|nr:aminotransferase class V-fold PLP-dependent enzyme [Rhodothermales bacterium]MBO6781200.1 aminotransferase class V-fold PLP-dependent enzyme [Rhodothermales bacterium]
MYSRRAFLGAVGRPAAAAVATAALNPAGIPALLETLNAWPGTPEELATDEEFWYRIQQAWTVDRSLVNLNNGGVSPAPAVVQDAMKRHLDYSNKAPVYTMWRILEPQREGVRQRIAREFGADGEEIALTRNASEGLQICQLGIDLRAGDEVLTTTHDYGRMITTFQQRERREGIKLVQFPLPIPAEDDDEVVRLFEEHITPRTKAILMCHIVNITGQILPVKKVVHMARRYDIPVIVDGAHSFAHFTFKHEDLDCDYYATSLHKWLFAPHGTGMLYVRKDKIPGLWPMMAAPEKMDGDIRKFEEIGTHPAANYLAIGEALTFHQGIGADRKTERLRYLTRYWADTLLEDPRVTLQTSLKPGQSCGIGVVDVDGIDCAAIGRFLWDRHRIIVTPIKHAEFEGNRITPNVYTTLEELDRFVDAMQYLLNHGLPDKYKA